MLMGKKIGAFSAVFDIFKAFFAVTLARQLFPACAIAREVAAVACILGHIFPLFMHFKGGKGLACIGGSIMAYNLKFFLLLLTIEIVLALVTDYICVIPLTVAVAVPLLYARHCESVLALFLLTVTALVVIFKHMENIRRILEGREARISFLWNRDEEVARLKENWQQEEPEIK